jgi:2-methylisocitrate lyase-like PEP mutase family enzyme
MLARTVTQYARAGVAGLHIEDQIQTKRCGHLLGKQVVSREEFITRIRAAVIARDSIPGGSNLVIIGRTDSAQVLGMEEAVHRLKLAADAGADVCFIEGVKTKELLESTVKALAPKPVRTCICDCAAELTWLFIYLISGSCQRRFGRTHTFIHDQGSRKNGRQNNQ